jgi:LuxR family maltose regulon positive regulatory protein
MPPLPRQRERRVVRADGFVPVEAKLHGPRLRDGLVLRGELVDKLREAADVPVVLVTSPPGYGKSTVIAQWDEEDARPFVWLSVDRADNDPAVLVTYLALALQRLGLLDPGVLGALADAAPVSDVLLPRLGRMLSRIEGPFVLVVDDADALTESAALDVLTTVADHLNEGSQLVVAARMAPRLPWGLFRTQRRLLAIGMSDLKLAPTEARALLAATGVELPAVDLAALLESTEGWAAGLYLAALSVLPLQRHGPASVLTGGESLMAEYLRDELLDDLPADWLSFLIQSSVLSRMSGSACDRVLARTGSGQILRELQRSNLFIVRLDDKDEWYRYHHLFAGMLRAELQRRKPAVVPLLHSRASRFCEDIGDIGEAVRHAQAAHEIDRAAQLVWSQTVPCLASGRTATLQQWLDGFSGDQIIARAELAQTAAWYALATGHPVEHWISAAERATFDAERPDGGDALASGMALLHAAVARHGTERMLADARRADRLQAPDDLWRALTRFLHAVATLLTGSVEDAVRQMEDAWQLAQALGAHSHQALCLAQLSVLRLERGDWDNAAALIGSATDLIAEHDLADDSTMSLASCVHALVLAKRSRTDDARRHVQQAMRKIALQPNLPPWLAVETRYLLGRAHLMLGDGAAARTLLSEAQRAMRGAEDAVWLRERLEEAWRHVEQFPLAIGVGPSALTSAELRVLQLLPTYLSFEQIGKRLYVSRNTVKTQVVAAYRKLGVTSRAEAVERAQALGMIEVQA